VLIANDISDMGALTKLNISSNCLYEKGTTLLAAALKSNQAMTELNISSNAMTMFGDESGVAALADVIPGMGAMTSLNLASNMIGSEGAQHVAEAIKVSVLLRFFGTSSMLI
jgi:Ran GTPase-activating protein (RanGAP) involved in mRNA processing and transport